MKNKQFGFQMKEKNLIISHLKLEVKEVKMKDKQKKVLNRKQKTWYDLFKNFHVMSIRINSQETKSSQLQ